MRAATHNSAERSTESCTRRALGHVSDEDVGAVLPTLHSDHCFEGSIRVGTLPDGDLLAEDVPLPPMNHGVTNREELFTVEIFLLAVHVLNPASSS